MDMPPGLFDAVRQACVSGGCWWPCGFWVDVEMGG